MESDYPEPLNLGQDRMVTINQLVDIVAGIAGVRVTKKHVPGRRAFAGATRTITRLRKVLAWEPTISLEDGLERTYAWIEEQVRGRVAMPHVAGVERV
jgi:nucleoside-diphosphate-sugar epimerase